MCQECTEAHTASKASKVHGIKSIDIIMQEMKTKVTKLNEHILELNKQKSKIESDLLSVKREKSQLCNEIDEKIDQMIEQLNCHRKQLKDTIEKNKYEYIKELNECSKVMKRMESDINDRILGMQAVNMSQDLKRLKDILYNLTIDILIPKLPVDSSVKFQVDTRNVFNVNYYIDIKDEESMLTHNDEYEALDSVSSDSSNND
jgi:hypothetical protein